MRGRDPLHEEAPPREEVNEGSRFEVEMRVANLDGE
ncbi:hypothetical protein Pla52o_06010 [Novipirellula galeiformis]|uniref:Uncharacterized protein n=1 Tax=Novipirellula galeiformis TaxID=2528004 RepID=A0A5C6CQX1_9BACT|nr:hypothetical protein Pla52o_06010 [Novipirellula galeiformis]